MVGPFLQRSARPLRSPPPACRSFRPSHAQNSPAGLVDGRPIGECGAGESMRPASPKHSSLASRNRDEQFRWAPHPVIVAIQHERRMGRNMPIPEDLAKTESAAALAKRIRRKEVSPVEVVDAAIARIEAHNPKINALVIFGYDGARQAAKTAEAAIMRGDALGPLHGVPIA